MNQFSALNISQKKKKKKIWKKSYPSLFSKHMYQPQPHWFSYRSQCQKAAISNLISTFWKSAAHKHTLNKNQNSLQNFQQKQLNNTNTLLVYTKALEKIE